LFAVSLPLLIAVRFAPLPDGDRLAGTGGTAWRDLANGLRHLRRHRVLAPLMIVLAIGDLGFTGPLNIGLTLLAGTQPVYTASAAIVALGSVIGLCARSLRHAELPH
jgi:hypothetical protein